MGKQRKTRKAGALHWSVPWTVILGVLAIAVAALTYDAPKEHPDRRQSLSAEERAKLEVPPRVLTQEELVLESKHGPAPVLSVWDGLAPEVAAWFRSNLKDPSSLEVAAASEIDGNLVRGGWTQMVTYRAKNSFGAYDKESRLFIISNGSVIETIGEDD